MRLEVHLYWHTDTEDVDLGVGLLDALPSSGTLMTWVAPGQTNVVWKVVTVYVHPRQRRSTTDSQEAPDGQYGRYDLFAEPAQGPFHGPSPDSTL